MRRSLEDRFWPKVDKRGPDECWEWTGSRFPEGYGGIMYRHNPKKWTNIGAHRASYLLHYGEIPSGLVVCHRCDNPPCVNPAHLFLGTQKDNHDDMAMKGRRAVGERHGTAKLGDQDVLRIRDILRAGVRPYRAIGEYFGVSLHAIYKINKGIHWRSVARAALATPSAGGGAYARWKEQP